MADEIDILRDSIKALKWLALWRQALDIKDDGGGLARLAVHVRDLRWRLRFWDSL